MSRLIVAVSSRALFDLEDAHRIFEADGEDAYRRHHASSNAALKPGAAFPIVKALANAGVKARAPVEVIVVSRNTPETGVRIVKAIESAGLGAARGVFTGGAPSLVPYLNAFGVHLFLTKSPADAAEATAAGLPAAMMYDPPTEDFDPYADQVRIAFDGDSCLFSDESDQIYHAHGIEKFMQHERERSEIPLPPGPLAPFLHAIHRFQQASPGHRIFRVALVTARIGAARERAMRTLTSFGGVDEAYFCGDAPKAKFVSLFRPHIFFDDKHSHLELTSKVAPSALVPTADAEDPGLVAGLRP
jgi:5'-nucleotidase